MARITVEDCLDNVENRFELVLEAAKRARALSTGELQPTLSWDNDKPTVLALREIAEGIPFNEVSAEPAADMAPAAADIATENTSSNNTDADLEAFKAALAQVAAASKEADDAS